MLPFFGVLFAERNPLVRKEHNRVSVHRLSKIDICPDCGILPDDCLSSENRGVGIDGDVILDGRMALNRLKPPSLGQGQGAKGHPLVKPDIVSDDAGLSDDDSCPMVDEEAFADFRTGMNVDSGQGVGIFTDDPGCLLPPLLIEKMSDPIAENGFKAGIGGNDFPVVVTCRISFPDDFDGRKEKGSYSS